MFNLNFWKNALEWAIVVGAATFLSLTQATAAPSLKDFEHALIASGWAALYSFIKQLGGVQAITATVKVKVGSARHAAK